MESLNWVVELEQSLSIRPAVQFRMPMEDKVLEAATLNFGKVIPSFVVQPVILPWYLVAGAT